MAGAASPTSLHRSGTRSIAVSSVLNSQAKHRFLYKPAASAQRADAVLPYPTGVRRLSTRFNGVRGLLGGLRGEIRNLPWPPDKGFLSFCERIFCMRSIAVSSVQNPVNFLNRFSLQAKHHQPLCIDRAGEAPPSPCAKPRNHSEPLLMAGAASLTFLHSPGRRSTANLPA